MRIITQAVIGQAVPKSCLTVSKVQSIVVKKSFILLPGVLLLTAASSMAMSLGRHSGATLIGRPLDISVQAVLEAQDDVSSLCLEADVFYGDNRLEKSRVRVTLERSAPTSLQGLIRIRSSVLVDEPVVTFYVRAGCQLKTERRYVTLAELVSESASDRNTPLPMAAPSAAPLRPAVVPPFATDAIGAQAAVPKPARSVRRDSAGTPASSAQADPGNIAPDGAAPTAKPPRARAAGQASRAPVPGKARLKLEPLDLVIERNPQLKASAELLSIPAANPLERAAASALWRALSAQPQDILRDTEKLQALENSVRSLQAQSQKTLLSIDELNLKLQQAQADRYANTLVYALVAFLLAAMAGLAFLLRHRLSGHLGGSGDKPWWRKNEAFENQQEAWVDSLPAREEYGLGPNRLGAVPKSILVDIDVDFDLDKATSESGRIRPAQTPNFVDSAPFARKQTSGFGSSVMHPIRALKAEELFDVQQQADFFLSIGQPEQAIEVLRGHITENVEASALVYLDLFSLYHQLHRAAEYDSLRVIFNQRFNTQVPTFELYTDKNSGLESYQLALSRIEALWPSPKVLEIIEESLFRQPDSKGEVFNLEAYRELLLLYSVAKEIISPEPRAVAVAKKFDLPDRPVDSVESRPMTFMSTAIQPLSASMDANHQDKKNILVEPLVGSMVPPASLLMGLDIDFNDLSALDVNAESDSASDARFFAQFDKDAPGALPTSNSVPLAPAKGATDTDNLIDFDALDVPQVADFKSKLPKV